MRSYVWVLQRFDRYRFGPVWAVFNNYADALAELQSIGTIEAIRESPEFENAREIILRVPRLDWEATVILLARKLTLDTASSL